jgi:hypothetical protein
MMIFLQGKMFSHREELFPEGIFPWESRSFNEKWIGIGIVEMGKIE